MTVYSEDDRAELAASLEVLPEVDEVHLGSPSIDVYVAGGDFTSPRVLGTIAAHGWGITEAMITRSGTHLSVWPCAPSEVADE